MSTLSSQPELQASSAFARDISPSAAELGSSLSCALRVKELEGQLAHLRRCLICAFNQLLDLKDLNTGVHSTRLAEWSVRMAQAMGIDELHLPDIEIAALLHDIGKVGIPDAILKKPGRLAREEYALLRRHSEFGWSVLHKLPGFEQASLFILHHHENFDGSGYPAGLKNEEIPAGSRIVAVIDAFDAMVSSRPYRSAMQVPEAIRRLNLASGTQFDPLIVESFIPIAQTDVHAVFAAAGVPVGETLSAGDEPIPQATGAGRTVVGRGPSGRTLARMSPTRLRVVKTRVAREKDE